MKTLLIAWREHLSAVNMKLKPKVIWGFVITIFFTSSVTLSFYFGTAYQKAAFQSKSLSITAHLHQVDSSAALFFSELPDRNEVSYAELVDQRKYIPRKQPVLGEDYNSLIINRDIDHISVIIPHTHLRVMRSVSYSR